MHLFECYVCTVNNIFPIYIDENRLQKEKEQTAAKIIRKKANKTKKKKTPK